MDDVLFVFHNDVSWLFQGAPELYDYYGVRLGSLSSVENMVEFFSTAPPVATVQGRVLGAGGSAPSAEKQVQGVKTVTFKMWIDAKTSVVCRNRVRQFCNLLSLGVQTVKVGDYGYLLNGYLDDSPVLEWDETQRSCTVSFVVSFECPYVIGTTNIWAMPTQLTVPATGEAASTFSGSATNSSISTSINSRVVGVRFENNTSTTRQLPIKITLSNTHTTGETATWSFMFYSPQLAYNQQGYAIVAGYYAYILRGSANSYLWERAPLLYQSNVYGSFLDNWGSYGSVTTEKYNVTFSMNTQNTQIIAYK